MRKSIGAALLIVLSCVLVLMGQNLLKENNNNLESLTVEKEETLIREEYAIHCVVIEQWLDFWNFRDFQCIVIEDHTYLYESLFNRTFSKFEEIEQETLDDFFFKNASRYPLQDFFNLDLPVLLISGEEIAEFFQSGSSGWQDFYAKYPNSQGIMELSRVGFNTKRDQAIVYMGNQQLSLSGSGTVYYLIKVNGEWIVQDEAPAWIS